MPGITFGAASIALAALQAVPASAFWRMGCPGRLTLERIDPLFAPGSVSGHVHTVSGGSGFGFDTDYEQLRSSACSSCPIKQDISAYWTPKLYYMSDAEGSSFEDVPPSPTRGVPKDSGLRSSSLHVGTVSTLTPQTTSHTCRTPLVTTTTGRVQPPIQ